MPTTKIETDSRKDQRRRRLEQKDRARFRAVLLEYSGRVSEDECNRCLRIIGQRYRTTA